MNAHTLRTLAILTCFIGLAGCPEPVPVPGAGTGDAAGGAGAGPDGGPGGVGAPDPGGNSPNQARWAVKQGEGVTLSGTFAYEGVKTGKYRMDFRATPENGGPPGLVHTLELQGPGEWTTSAPKNAGKVDIIAFIDVDGDGPTEGDPAGATPDPIEVLEAPIADISIPVTDEPEEWVTNPRAKWPDQAPPNNDETQPGTPPEGMTPPSEGAPPPEGAEGSAPEGAPGGTPPEGEPSPAPEGAPGGGPEGEAAEGEG
jgi:hypothetical protein